MFFKLLPIAFLIVISIFLMYIFIKLSRYEDSINDIDYDNGSYSYDDAYGFTEDHNINNK